MGKVAYGLASVVSAVSLFAVSAASFLFIYQGETPEELLK